MISFDIHLTAEILFKKSLTFSLERKERDLLKYIDTLECNVNQASLQLLENMKQDLENIRKEKINGNIIRFSGMI